MKEALRECLLEKTNFWPKVLERLVNVLLMLAMYNLRFYGSRQELLQDNKGNFFFIVQLLAKYDTILDKLLQLLKGSPKCLIYEVQNELTSLLAEEVLRDIKSELQSAPFSAIILDTTQNVSKKNQ